jgi:hypothetical protein
MYEIITKDGCTLRHKESGIPVEKGRVYSTGDEFGEGETYLVTGGCPNLRNPASSGKVWCYHIDECDGSESDWQREFYPSVFNFVWVRDN